MRSAFLFAFTGICGFLCTQEAVASQTCAGFQELFVRAAPSLKAQFVRPVVVRRGPSDPGSEARDLVSEYSVDARLFCRGERFLRFEAQIAGDADAKSREGYYFIQEAAVLAAFRWPRPRVAQTIQALTLEAAEYLRGSRERGDVFISGKTERHAGKEGEIAVFWTDTERTFILVAASE
jgi:hypothetical protein